MQMPLNRLWTDIQSGSDLTRGPVGAQQFKDFEFSPAENSMRAKQSLLVVHVSSLNRPRREGTPKMTAASPALG
jgi:hypothetical protein